MKKLILISTLLLVGCSQEQDTRLVCDCQYESSIHNPSERDREFLSIMRGQEVEKDCMSFGKESTSETLVFNESKNKMVFSNPAWIFARSIDEQRTDFTNHAISYYQYSITSEIDDPISYKLDLDRISLILRATYYAEPIYMGRENKVTDGLITQLIYQCRVVDGV